MIWPTPCDYWNPNRHGRERPHDLLITDQQSDMSMDAEWADLTNKQKLAARTCGWCQKTWDDGEDTAVTSKSWDEIPPAKQRALKLLGHPLAEGQEGDGEGGEPTGAGDDDEWEAKNLKDYFPPGTQWVRASEIDPDACLYGDRGPCANDVLQNGKSAHCWFLSTCAALAEKYPDYIRSLIEDKGDGNYGMQREFTFGLRWTSDFRIRAIRYNLICLPSTRPPPPPPSSSSLGGYYRHNRRQAVQLREQRGLFAALPSQ